MLGRRRRPTNRSSKGRSQKNRSKDRPLQQKDDGLPDTHRRDRPQTGGKPGANVGEKKGTMYRAHTEARGKPTKDAGVPRKQSLFLFGPGRDDAANTGVSDEPG